ncbi:VirD-like protein [Halorubrum sp. DM2]|uniref:TraM recognition domain-containing protein n=1 Tax=Halorubrum sp. DM2 TaxID=2527867 RepID=UPI0024B6E71A|nr:TraM recognition domain-containing protein [Halorubrum sp. DM2]VTT86284.1 VirD-like protein [Halorubrum sp. DM2]
MFESIFGGGDDEDENTEYVNEKHLGTLYQKIERTAETVESRKLSIDHRDELSGHVANLLTTVDELTHNDESPVWTHPDQNPTTDHIADDLRDLKDFITLDRLPKSTTRSQIQAIQRDLVQIENAISEMPEFGYAYEERDRRTEYGAEIQSIGIPDHVDPDELDAGESGKEVYAAGESRKVLEDLPRNYDDVPLFVGKGTRNGRDASIEKDHLFRHRAIFGVTDYGKSTLLTNDARQLIESGAGLCYIDPKGDDARRLMEVMPEHRLDDVVWIEPGATGDYLSGFNFISLNMDPDEDGYNAALASLVEDLKQMLAANDDYWGPRMDRVAQSIITGMNQYNAMTPDDAPEMNFVDMYYVLKSEASRHEFTARLKKAGMRFITPHMETVAEMPEDDLEPLLGRFLPWIQNPVARRMIGFRSGGVSIPDAIDNDKIIIVRMGSEPRQLKQMLGMSVIRRIWSHIRGRATTSEHERSPFYLFCDEFDNLALADETIPSMISESRSYRLAMTLANQYPDQLPQKVIDAITTNCDTIMSFNPGDKKSARTYCTQLGLDPEDLTEEVNYHYWMRTTISENMERSEAFRVYAHPPFPPVRDVDAREEAIDASLQEVGRERRSDEEVYQNLLFNEGQGRWETGIGQKMAMVEDKDEKLFYARELQNAVPGPENPGIGGGTSGDATAASTTPMSGGEGSGSAGETPGAFGASTADDAESVVERHLDTVLESIFAARLRAGKQADQYVPVDDAKDELVARLEDATIDSLSELSNIYERVNSSYAETEREGGESVIRLTPEGRGVVLQQDTGSAGSGGGDDHRWILGQCYVAFTQIGYVSWLPEQEGEEMPDGVAEAPIDVTDVDEDQSRSEMLDAIDERREQLREEYPGVWNFAGADDVSIEAETSTIKYPFQTFTNLRKAMEKGEKCVFAVKDGSANHGSFTYWGERAEKVIYETEGQRQNTEVVSDEIAFRKSPGKDGNLRYYNDGGGDYRVGDEKVAVRERREEDDEGNGTMSMIWYRDTDTGEVVAAVGDKEPAPDGEIARFDGPEAAHEGDKNAVPAYYEYDQSEGEYVVYHDGEKLYYPSKEELEANWVTFRGPFIPEARFPEWPDHEDFEIIIFPDGDNDEYDQPQLYHRGECTPLFDHLGVESVDDVDAGEIEGPGEVEDATADEPADEEETAGDGEPDESGESPAESGSSGDTPASDAPAVEGFEEAPTPARIASDDRVDLTVEEITATAEGEYTPPTQQKTVLLTIVNSLAADPDYMATTPDEVADLIVLPEEVDEGGTTEEATTGESDESAEATATGEASSEADERGEEGERAPDENDETIGMSPENPGLSHPGYNTAPTPTEIAKDDRLELTPEEIAAIARGERDMTVDEAVILQSILKRLAKGTPEYPTEEIPGEIVIPVDGVGAYATDEEAAGEPADESSRDEGTDSGITPEEAAEIVEEQGEVTYKTEPTPVNISSHPDVSVSPGLLRAARDGDATLSREQEGTLRAALTDFSVGEEPPIGLDADPVKEIVTNGSSESSEVGEANDSPDTQPEPNTDRTKATGEASPAAENNSDAKPNPEEIDMDDEAWDSLIDAELSDSESSPETFGGAPAEGHEQQGTGPTEQDPNTDSSTDDSEASTGERSGRSEPNLSDVLNSEQNEDDESSAD